MLLADERDLASAQTSDALSMVDKNGAPVGLIVASRYTHFKQMFGSVDPTNDDCTLARIEQVMLRFLYLFKYVLK